MLNAKIVKIGCLSIKISVNSVKIKSVIVNYAPILINQSHVNSVKLDTSYKQMLIAPSVSLPWKDVLSAQGLKTNSFVPNVIQITSCSMKNVRVVVVSLKTVLNVNKQVTVHRTVRELSV